jgi:hypothetical protein
MASTLSKFESSAFFLVGHLNIILYAATVDNEEARHHCGCL